MWKIGKFCLPDGCTYLSGYIYLSLYSQDFASLISMFQLHVWAGVMMYTANLPAQKRKLTASATIPPVNKGESPEVLVTPRLGGWVSLGLYFFFQTSKKYDFLGVFMDFWHNLGQELDLVPCGRVLILKVPYWNCEDL